MVKPDWCPQGVWDEAIKIEGGSNPMLVDRIARAIMSAEKRGEEREREACLAAIRSLHADAWGITEEQSALDDAIAALERRGAVVAAIRNRGAEQ